MIKLLKWAVVLVCYVIGIIIMVDLILVLAGLYVQVYEEGFSFKKSHLIGYHIDRVVNIAMGLLAIICFTCSWEQQKRLLD